MATVAAATPTFQRKSESNQGRELIAGALFAELLLIVVASSKFYPRYIRMFLPLGLLDENHWLSRLTLAISLWELLALTFIGQTHILNYLLNDRASRGFDHA